MRLPMSDHVDGPRSIGDPETDFTDVFGLTNLRNPVLARTGPSATDGEIAAINLESARRRAWAHFAEDTRRPGAAETVVERERLAAQFLGDLNALDRLDAIASQFARVDLSLIHISEPTRLLSISYAVFCLKKKKK